MRYIFLTSDSFVLGLFPVPTCKHDVQSGSLPHCYLSPFIELVNTCICIQTNMTSLTVAYTAESSDFFYVRSNSLLKKWKLYLKPYKTSCIFPALVVAEARAFADVFLKS